MAGSHVEPPKHIGTGKAWIARFTRLPNFFTLNQAVGLTPKPNFTQISKQPTIGHHAGLVGRQAGHESRLCGASDGRQGGG